jgi:acetylornithine deacetylase/succinyl-diaminopimelate desuccinylase-like protein
MLSEALEHARSNRQTYLNQLFDFLRIPSISTLAEHVPDMRRAAEWLATDMRRVGMKSVEILPTDGHPVVYGEWLDAGSEAPTVLVYGHYDVQPVDPLDLWDSPPFEPEVRDGKLYARGASDDKGQLFTHVKAVESILASGGKLPINVKMFFEGEEEIGSQHLTPFVLANTDRLAADSTVISDGQVISADQPSITYGLRGMAYMEIKVRGPKRDLHSGSYGGSIHNPAQVVGEIIASLHDKNGHILIPGFYDKVRSISDEERELLNQVPDGLENWQKETGLKEPWGEPDFSLIERVSSRPTCEVNGIWGGFQGKGMKTIIPAEAGAKISMRLVADQDPFEIADLFTEHVKRVASDSVEVEVSRLSTDWPAFTPIDSQEMQAASRAYEAVWGVAPVFTRTGGTIPIVAVLQKELNAPTAFIGFGLDDNIHAPNENFVVDHFYKGIETIIHYYYDLAR